MKTAETRLKELDEEIAALKRRRRELHARGKTGARKKKTRALILIGGICSGVFDSNPSLVNFIRARSVNLKSQDREVLSSVFPDVFPQATENQRPENV